MSGAKMNDGGIIEMGLYKLFTTEDAAIMYASMVASQGKEIISLLRHSTGIGDYPRKIKTSCGFVWFGL